MRIASSVCVRVDEALVQYGMVYAFGSMGVDDWGWKGKVREVEWFEDKKSLSNRSVLAGQERFFC